MSMDYDALGPLFELSRDAVVGVKDNRICFANPAAGVLFGIQAGGEASPTFPPELFDGSHERASAVLTVAGKPAELSLRRSDGVYLLCLRPAGAPEPDRLANLTGEMLGSLYRWREDEWADSLEKIGQSLGRFIYLMDAYDDLEGDLHHGRYNPLRELSGQEDFEELIRQSMMLVMGECTREFELLPLIRDVDILRNILYGGCWGRYQLKQQKREKDKPAVKRQGRQEGGA